MAYKTTSNAKGLIILETELKQKNEEITELRRYRKRAKKAYRQLQVAFERVTHAYTDLYRLSNEFRELVYADLRKPEVTTKPGQPVKEKRDAKKPNKKS